MFRRRTPRPLPSRVRELLWPRAGWRRWGQYLAHRIKRMPGTPHGIASGLACGAAVSCAPLPGLHFFLAALMAVLMRGNPVAGAVGTAFGNPWTFPILWGVSYRVGHAMTPGTAGDPLDTGEIVALMADLTRAVLHLDASLLAERVLPVWTPTMLGSLPVGLVVWVAVYVPFRSFIARYRERRRQRTAAHRAARHHPHATVAVPPSLLTESTTPRRERRSGHSAGD